MTDPRALFREYLKQQIELGQPGYVLEGGAAERLNDRPAERPPEPAQADPAQSTVDGPLERPPFRRSAVPSADRSVRRSSPPPPSVPGPGITVPAPPRDLFVTDPLAGCTMAEVEALVHGCTKCVLHRERKHAVPGEGPLAARLVVVGEGPGATEDEQGRPFVGRAGELLTDILAAMGCPRDTVYICNVVKCRPPGNRKPMADEIEACLPYLHRQLAIIGPKVILAMGATAAEALLNTKASLSALRNKVHDFRGTPLIVTYHPAALLRNPHWKRPTWDDVRIARQLLDR